MQPWADSVWVSGKRELTEKAGWQVKDILILLELCQVHNIGWHNFSQNIRFPYTSEQAHIKMQFAATSTFRNVISTIE